MCIRDSTNTDLKFKDVKPLPGYIVGVMGIYDLSIVSLQGEVLYTSNKFNTIEEKNSNTVLTTYNLDVSNGKISIPVTLNLGIGPFIFGIGPQLDKLVSSKAVGTISNLASGNTTITDVAFDYINDTSGIGAYKDFATKPENMFNDLGISANLSFGYNFGNVRADIKLNYSLTDAINDFYLKNSSSQSEKTVIGSLTLAYIF